MVNNWKLSVLNSIQILTPKLLFNQMMTFKKITNTKTLVFLQKII